MSDSQVQMLTIICTQVWVVGVACARPEYKTWCALIASLWLFFMFFVWVTT